MAFLTNFPPCIPSVCLVLRDTGDYPLQRCCVAKKWGSLAVSRAPMLARRDIWFLPGTGTGREIREVPLALPFGLPLSCQ